jgi:hypothetical protein
MSRITNLKAAVLKAIKTKRAKKKIIAKETIRVMMTVKERPLEVTSRKRRTSKSLCCQHPRSFLPRTKEKSAGPERVCSYPRGMHSSL